MSEINHKKTFCDSSGSDIVEEDNCRIVEMQEVLVHREEVVREKRLRSSSDDMLDEDGFTTVRSKRSAKVPKTSVSVLSCGRNENENLPSPQEKIIVCVSGKDILPKQFKMAKLLRSESILQIINIQYKTPFKIFIAFESIESAHKLIECKNIIDMGFKCQLLNEMSVSYGIIRNVDLDIEDEEIKENLESDFEIVSIQRLKRATSTGKWVESETIRIGFKGSILPTFVRGYGCRFKVDPYMYPVTQCTGCWRYGHNIRFCPSRKIVCPKCTEYHPNCEISADVYKCVNCKGNHMALDKLCPIFLKEKNIRIIMRDLNYTYKKALSIYLSENDSKNENEQTQEIPTRTTSSENKNTGRSYKDVLLNQTNVHSENQESSDEENYQEKEMPSTNQRIKRKKKTKKRNRTTDTTEANDDIVTGESDTDMSLDEQDNDNTKKKQKGKSSIIYMKLIHKLKEIYMSDCTVDVKIKTFISFIIEEIMNYVTILFRDNDVCTWLLSKLNYG